MKTRINIELEGTGYNPKEIYQKIKNVLGLGDLNFVLSTDTTTSTDIGRDKAEFNANRKIPGWTEMALGYLYKFIQTKKAGEEFFAEDFRNYALKEGLPTPPSLRAFGGIMVKGYRRGFLIKVGLERKGDLAHRTPAVLWTRVGGSLA